MHHEQENFQQLRRLLALKRHEQPPPGFFNDFSSQVIARIQAEERLAEATVLERLLAEAPWLQRIWGLLESKPVLVGAAGATFCGLMLAVILASEHVDTTPIPLVPVTVAQNPAQQAAVPVVDDTAAPAPLFNRPATIDLSNPSVVPVSQPRPSLFQDFEKTRSPWVGVAEPASFKIVNQ
ncbi:MAG TPA: hypothetical protein VN578_25565 [Candidatus Binatia bacterium]|jgi:hypothetical protein|nr:hypothetical protein [Candidatus Binatia bacterium]